MRIISLALFFIFTSLIGYSQEEKSFFKHVKRKDKLFVYWGWNRSNYTKSNISFKGGDDYSFILKKVKAFDRQTPFNLKTYFHPSTCTIPQYQYRIGYYINDHYNISWGFNHMKYVMSNNQEVKINGKINSHNGGIYNGEYDNNVIHLDRDFVRFEHTDGLNYLGFNFERIDAFWVSKNKKQNLNIVEGIGVGVLFPRSNVHVFNQGLDEWHIAGYGTSMHIALRFDFLRHFFIQAQLEGGYINMPDILTTGEARARATQHFFYFERMINFGGYITLFERK